MLIFWAIATIAVVLLILTVTVGDVLDGVFDAMDFTGGYLSSTAVLSFLGTFGLVGALLMGTLDLSGLAASGGGLAAGLIVGAASAAMSKALLAGPTAHQVTSADYLGQVATVTTPIPTQGLGQVNLTVAGHTTALAARSEGPVDAGAVVVVTAVLTAGTVEVAPRT